MAIYCFAFSNIRNFILCSFSNRLTFWPNFFFLIECNEPYISIWDSIPFVQVNCEQLNETSETPLSYCLLALMALVKIAQNISFTNQLNLDANLSSINVNNATAVTTMCVRALFSWQTSTFRPAFVCGIDFELKMYLNCFPLFHCTFFSSWCCFVILTKESDCFHVCLLHFCSIFVFLVDGERLFCTIPWWHIIIKWKDYEHEIDMW